jgi:hypothetical protein
MRRRQTMRSITRITNTQGIMHTDNHNILKTFTNYLKEKYGNITPNNAQLQRIRKHMPARLSEEANSDLETPVSTEEIKTAIKKRKKKKITGTRWKKSRILHNTLVYNPRRPH